MTRKTDNPATPETLTGLISEMETRLAALPSGWGTDRAAWEARQKPLLEMVADLTARGARVRSNWNGTSIKLAGIRSSSTSGIEGALQNWIAAARRRIDAISTEAGDAP